MRLDTGLCLIGLVLVVPWLVAELRRGIRRR